MERHGYMTGECVRDGFTSRQGEGIIPSIRDEESVKLHKGGHGMLIRLSK